MVKIVDEAIKNNIARVQVINNSMFVHLYILITTYVTFEVVSYLQATFKILSFNFFSVLMLENL